MVADSQVGAAGGAGARIRGVVSGWPRGRRPVEASATPLAPFISQLLPCHMARPCFVALFGCVFFIDIFVLFYRFTSLDAEGEDWALERGVGLGWTRTLRERV
eukprot:scaffold11037_cov124-Isochrysis_galbana.AAC.2